MRQTMTQCIQLSSPTRQDIVNWVNRVFVFLQKDKAKIQRSFELCGITIANSWLVPHDDFLKRVMANTEMDSNQTDDDDAFQDLPEN